MSTTSVGGRIRGLAAAAVLACASTIGCDAPKSKPTDVAVQYTPEGLAQELAFRYQALAPSARVAGPRRDEPSETGRHPAVNLDEVLREIEAKAARITDQPRAEVFRKMAEAIGKEEALDPADRQALADRLKEMGKPD